MEEEQIKIFADSLWDYLLEKKLKQYLSDSVCYYMASVVEPASNGFITVQRPFDDAVTLPCGANAENLAVGDACAVLVFGDFSNQIVIGNVAELTGKITNATETTLNGVLVGSWGTVQAIPVDSVPTASSTNLVTSGGVKSAIDAVGGFAQATEITSNSDLNNITTPGVYFCTNYTVAETLSNSPITTSGFEMTVAPSDSSGVIQMIYCSVSTVSKLYIRRKNGSTWYPWFSPARITSVTETSLNGVLAGDGSTIAVKPVDSVPTASSTNLVTSGGVKSAIDDVGGLNQSTAITSGTDLDTLTTPGAYNCTNSSIAATLINCPVSGSGFSLLVTRKSAGAYPEQLIICADTMFTRHRLSGGWSSWSRHGNTNYLQSIITASGVLQGDGNGGVTEKAVDSTPTLNSTNLVTSGGVQSALTRPNLLDNWYFIGGGSQQGGNQFPINERGQTSYTLGTSYSYFINQWKGYRGTVTLESDHINYYTTDSVAAYKRILQLTGLSIASGTTFTLSMVARVNSVSGWAVLRPTNNGAGITGASGLQLEASEDYQLISYTFTTGSNAANLGADIIVNNTATATLNIDIKAIKLELGSAQTLAHQENGVWVLNELPNYEEQLIRCKTSIATADDSYANDEVMFQSMLHFERPNWTMTGGKVFKITFPAYYRGIIYTFGSGVATKSEIIVSTTSNAAVSYASALAGSGVSVAKSGATLTLTNTTASTYIYVFIDTFSDTQPTWEEVTS